MESVSDTCIHGTLELESQLKKALLTMKNEFIAFAGKCKPHSANWETEYTFTGKGKFIFYRQKQILQANANYLVF